MKKVIALILSLVLCVSLFACTGSKDDSNPTSEPTAVSDPTTVPNPTTPPEPTEKPESFYDKLLKGYSLDMSEAEMQAAEGWDVIQIKDIPDDAAKQAFLDNGHADTDYVLEAAGDVGPFVNDINLNTDSDMADLYEVGNKVKVTVEYYSTATGAGGFLIALNGGGNHTFANAAFKPGYNNLDYSWTVEPNEYAITLYHVPQTVYVAAFKVTLLNDIYSKEVYVDDTQIEFKDCPETFTGEGYLYDFKADNIPNLGLGAKYVRIDKIPADVESYAAMKAGLTAANGFSDYAFRTDNGTVEFFFIRDLLKAGNKYTISFRYLADEPLDETAEFMDHLVVFANQQGYNTDGNVYGAPASDYANKEQFVATPVAGVPNLYDVTGSVEVLAEEVNLFTAYSQKSQGGFVGSIKIVEAPIAG